MFVGSLKMHKSIKWGILIWYAHNCDAAVFTFATSRRNILQANKLKFMRKLWTMIVKSRKLENFRLKIEMSFSLTCKWSPKIWALYCCLLLDFHWQKYGSCLCQIRVNLQHFLAPINSRLCRLVLNSQGGNNKITHNRARQSSQETRKTFFFCFFCLSHPLTSRYKMHRIF